MALAPFFDRIHASSGRALSMSPDGLADALSATAIGVRLDPWAAESQAARWTAEFLVNLLSRLYPRLVLEGPAASIDPLRELARSINQQIDLGGEPSIRVVLGDSELGAPSLYPTAAGWCASVGLAPDKRGFGEPNPFASAAAASLCAAEVFRLAFRERVPDLSFVGASLSLLDYSSNGTGADLALPAHELGQVAFLGVGAVANSALWALSRTTSLSGELVLVDADRIERSNLQRYALTTAADERRLKVELAAHHLANSGLGVRSIPQRLEQFADDFPIPRVVCVSVDNIPGRRAVQALLPRTAVNGWTGRSGLGASWHELTSDQPCLACLYHPRGPGRSHIQLVAEALGLPERCVAQLWVRGAPLAKEDRKAVARHHDVPVERLEPWADKTIQEVYTAVACGEVALNPDRTRRLETVPLAHQSALAGILMGVELLKRTSSDLGRMSQPENVIQWEDVLRPPPPVWTLRLAKDPGCICSDPVYVARYRERWA